MTDPEEFELPTAGRKPVPRAEDAAGEGPTRPLSLGGSGATPKARPDGDVSPGEETRPLRLDRDAAGADSGSGDVAPGETRRPVRLDGDGASGAATRPVRQGGDVGRGDETQSGRQDGDVAAGETTRPVRQGGDVARGDATRSGRQDGDVAAGKTTRPVRLDGDVSHGEATRPPALGGKPVTGGPDGVPAAVDRDDADGTRADSATEDDGPTARLWQGDDGWFGAADDADQSGTAYPSEETQQPASVPDGGSSDRVNRVNGVEAVGASDAAEDPVPSENAEDDHAERAESGGPGSGLAGITRKITPASAVIWVLLALFGYALVAQLRSNTDDQGLATARQEDLVSILSDLESRDSRLQSEIAGLEQSQQQLTSGVSSRQAALSEAQKRSDELGLLAGTLPGKGPGLKISVDKVKASAILNAVEELRGAGGEVMELAGNDGATVRIVASSYFVDAQGGGILVDGVRLTGPYTLWVIGQPSTMQTALQIPGGVVESVKSGGGSVTMEAQTLVQVTAVRKATTLQYARPVS